MLPEIFGFKHTKKCVFWNHDCKKRGWVKLARWSQTGSKSQCHLKKKQYKIWSYVRLKMAKNNYFWRIFVCIWTCTCKEIAQIRDLSQMHCCGIEMGVVCHMDEVIKSHVSFISVVTLKTTNAYFLYDHLMSLLCTFMYVIINRTMYCYLKYVWYVCMYD